MKERRHFESELGFERAEDFSPLPEQEMYVALANLWRSTADSCLGTASDLFEEGNIGSGRMWHDDGIRFLRCAKQLEAVIQHTKPS